MKQGLPIVIGIAVMFVLAALSGCSGAGGDAPSAQSQMDDSEQPMVNRIAYIDNSGDLRIINPDGTENRRLTGDVRAGIVAQALQRGDSYGWPTWSSDGTRIAASRVSLGVRHRRAVGAGI